MKNKSEIKSYVLRFLIILGFITYLELLFALFIFRGASWGMLFGFLFGFPLSFVLLILSGLWSEKVNRILISVFLTVIDVLFMAQFIYKTIFNSYLQVYSIVNGLGVKNAFQFFGVVVSCIVENWYAMLLFLLPLGLLFAVALPSRSINWKKIFWKNQLISLGFAVVSFFVAFATLYLPETSGESPATLYKSGANFVMNVKELGVMTSMRLDARRLLFGASEEASWTVDPDPEWIDELEEEESLLEVIREAEEKLEAESSTDPQTQDPFGDDQAEGSTELQEERTMNILDIDFDQLIADAPNDTIRSLHQYFSVQEPTYINDYTGYFEGYNLIYIVAESFSRFALDEELTPTLYKMANHGFVFENYYQPLYFTSTSDGEFVSTTSLLPSPNIWSYGRSAENAMPFGLGNLLTPMGYECRAYHDFDGEYYERNLSHPNMGYDFRGILFGLEIQEQWPESDLEMIQASVPDFIGQEPFHTYYMTVSGHLPYRYDISAMAAKHEQETVDLPYDEEIRAYLASNLELEDAMTYLLDQLEKAGVADHTVIIITPDHYPYGLSDDNLSILNGRDINTGWDRYRTSLIMYCPGMTETVKVEKTASSLDLLPTICNLFGIEYDSRLMIGHDIFSNSEGMMITSGHNFLTDRVAYNVEDGTIEYFDETMTAEEAEELRQRVDNSYAVSEAVLENDYYSYLAPYLDWWDGQAKGHLFDPETDQPSRVPDNVAGEEISPTGN